MSNKPTNQPDNTTETCICQRLGELENELLASGCNIELYMRKGKDHAHYIYAVAEDNTDFVKLNFCPFCGRNLKESE